MTYRSAASLLFSTLLTLAATAHAGDGLNSGKEKNVPKALSEKDVRDYLSGAGMGTSKVAELNQYAGPKNVLEHAAELSLSPESVEKTKKIFDAVITDSSAIGKKIVQKEIELDGLYASRKATVQNTTQLVKELTALQADFRLVHLTAHLNMEGLLSPEQLALYYKLVAPKIAGPAVAPANSAPKHH